jgi:pimeloyl-ACP methyl ester carboxylesterase
MPTLARDAAGVISGTGFSSAHVLGFSMGGAVAQELVIRYPFCVDRLVLFSTYAGVGFTIPAAWDAQRRLFEVDSLSAEEAARQVWPVTYSPEFLKRNLPFVEAQMRREIATPTPDYVARGQRAGLRRFSSGLRLWQICACTLVITGDEDQLIPPGNSRLIASMIRGAHFESLSGLGHRAIWEAPEKIADFVIDFLEASK